MRHLFHCLKQVLNSILTTFSTSAIFCLFVSLLPLWKNASHWGLFSPGETNKGHSGQDGVNREGREWVSPVCGQTLLNTQHNVGRCAHKSPIMKWANTLKESSKKFTEAKAASHNTTSWHADPDGFLEHSTSRGSLYYKGPAFQKISPFLGGSPLVYTFTHIIL